MVIEPANEDPVKTVPIEDIGMVVLDCMQLTLSHGLMMALMENNAVLVSCNYKHLPDGLLAATVGHHAMQEKVRAQLEASEPLKKNMWQQTVSAKIRNQAALLNQLGQKTDNMLLWAKEVRSGDPDNYEARAASYYWDNLFGNIEIFRRGRFGSPPNNLLNYGYALLRAVIARSLVASGFLLQVGIHHKNKYNPYVLADDIMEPYRPYVDKVVVEIAGKEEDIEELTPALKRQLLVIPAMDIQIDGEISPLMVGAQRTTASLMKCFEGDTRKILYPAL